MTRPVEIFKTMIFFGFILIDGLIDVTSFTFRIFAKRDIYDNIRKDDPKSKCRNGGIYAGGQCHCIHPHTGKTCEDFACVHGISVGRRYDPLSLIFSKPCICDEGWKGDLCEYHLTDRCSNRGEWKNNKCECIGSFFGDECQFTSRCDNGIIKHGRCICNKHFEGDYCERIICYHGYANLKNMSRSCICPAKYKGLHCDQCSQVGPKILPYPICTVNYIPSLARQSRRKTHQQVNISSKQKERRKSTDVLLSIYLSSVIKADRKNSQHSTVRNPDMTVKIDVFFHLQIKHRFAIMAGAVTFLVVIAVSMCAFHVWHQRRKNPEVT
ncbi:unnamed protein product [Angiostrongylus costaricensis]|uniref:EGF-like domain-containing protein n=1 Tax=Angiostrongylus costaricensis TaxID=334426 RepID=A0A0R3PYB3_ANGCS|nr:unnamed protein product [Angiostrongylus costaricensis]